jgi:hypothetical protein
MFTRCLNGVAGSIHNSPRRSHFYERNQYFLRSAYRARHDPTPPLDAQAETTAQRVSITTDVPILRIDHIEIKGILLGVWQALYSSGALDFKMNRYFVRVPYSGFPERTLRGTTH